MVLETLKPWGSALTALGMVQPRAWGFLEMIDPCVLAPNYCIYTYCFPFRESPFNLFHRMYFNEWMIV